MVTLTLSIEKATGVSKKRRKSRPSLIKADDIVLLRKKTS